MPLGDNSRSIVLRFVGDNSNLKGSVADTKTTVRQMAAEIEREDAASHRRLSTGQLRDLRRSHAEQLREHARAAKAAADEYERHLGSGFFSKLGHAASRAFSGGLGILGGALSVAGGNFLTGAVSKLAGGLKDEITTAFDFLDLQERAKIGFATIFRNAGLSAEEASKKADQHLKDLFDFGAKTPFRAQQLIELSQQLQAVGFKAEEIIPTLRSVGDAVAGLGGDPQKLDRILLQIGQIKTKGKVSGEELTTLAESGINAWKYLAQYSGKTVAEVQKLAQQNALDSDVAVKVIVAGMGREFQGLMKETEGSYSSMWSTIEDLNQQRAAQAFAPTFEEVKKGQRAAIMGLESGAAEGYAKGAADVQKVLLGGFDKILAGVASGDFKQLGFGALESVVSGAQAGAKGLYDAGSKAGQQLEQGWRDRMEQHSPSAVMQGLGFDAGQSLLFGFLKGVQDKATLERIERAIQEAAKRFNLDPDLIRAIIKKESDFRPGAVSSAGAMGLMQLMPATAASHGVKDPFNIEQNIMGGAKYLRELLDLFSQRTDIALAAYNSGEHRREYERAAREGRPIDFSVLPRGVQAQTEPYVPAVMRNYTRYSTGVDSPLPSGAQAEGRAVSAELATLEARLKELKVEELDHLEVLQLEAQRLGRWHKSLREQLAQNPFAAAADPEMVAHKKQVENALEENAKEYEAYFLGMERQIGEVNERLKALRGAMQGGSDPRNMGLAADLPGRSTFNVGQFLKPVDPGALPQLVSDTQRATQAHYEYLKALGQTGAAADEGFGQAGAAAGAFGSLIKQTGKEAEKDASETAKNISGMAGNLLGSALRGQWREGLRGLEDDFKSWIVRLAEEWLQSKILKLLSPDSAGGASGSGGASSTGGGGLFSSLKHLFNFGGGSSTSATSASADSSASAGNASALAGGMSPDAAVAALMAGYMIRSKIFGPSVRAALGDSGFAKALAPFVSDPMMSIIGTPATIALALFGLKKKHATEKALRKAIRETTDVDISEMDLLTQIKQIGEQAFGKGQVRKHIYEVIRLDEVQQLIDDYGERTGQGKPKLPHEFLYNATGSRSTPITVNGSTLMSSPFSGSRPLTAGGGLGGDGGGGLIAALHGMGNIIADAIDNQTRYVSGAVERNTQALNAWEPTSGEAFLTKAAKTPGGQRAVGDATLNHSASSQSFRRTMQAHLGMNRM